MIKKSIKNIQPIGFQWEMESPFLFCAHHRDNFPAGNDEMGPAVNLSGRNIGSDFSGKDGFSMYHGSTVPGFPVHPHRGFETVTVVLEGLIDHFDSAGATGRYGNGDVQWLTTGAGCQHAEMFPLIHKDKPNPVELFQIWLNLPSKQKFAEPAYRMLWSEDIPVAIITGENQAKASVRVIAGTMDQVVSLPPCPASYAASQSNHVGIFLIRMESESSITLPAVSPTISRNLYFYRGEGLIEIEGTSISPSNRIKLDGNVVIEVKNGIKESFLILLEGERLDEPVYQYGPFVMNSEEEVRRAFADYRATQFGGWTWDRPDPVHPRETGRFSKFPDGSVEKRN